MSAGSDYDYEHRRYATERDNDGLQPERPKLSDPARGTPRLLPRCDGQVRRIAWLGDSVMGISHQYLAAAMRCSSGVMSGKCGYERHG
jgi:hypothetical protein